MAKVLFQFLIFPGFLFLSVVGGILSWVDRKLTARVHFRKGPPLLQPFYDLIKLSVKETTVPENASARVFLATPILALTASVISGILILLPALNISSGFRGDLLVIIYLLAVPAVTTIIGALASGNPLSAVGASREIKLLISYELPFLLTILALVIRSDMSISLSDLIAKQAVSGVFIGSFSGALGFIVIMMVIQAKLSLVPFDMAEAETEIIAGVITEYSGIPLGLIKLTRFILLFVLPSFVISLFLGGFDFTGWNILGSILKIVLIILLITLVRNTNPRVKIKAAMKFFFIWMNLFALLSIILAIMGY
ncbi:MAG: NADH-quinone oxidoreductase subunit H [Spirochaetes bacterium]|nr:NADH-quinone oxidoreductase subunit H [Spirochaetota bacterium]